MSPAPRPSSVGNQAISSLVPITGSTASRLEAADFGSGGRAPLTAASRSAGVPAVVG